MVGYMCIVPNRVCSNTPSVIEVKQGLESPAVRKKIDDDENKARRLQDTTSPEYAMGNPTSSSSLEAENSEFVNNHSKRTHELIQQQDKGLENLSKAVDG